jgi:hypothetical protein
MAPEARQPADPPSTGAASAYPGRAGARDPGAGPGLAPDTAGEAVNTSAEAAPDDPPLPPWLAAFSLILFTALAVLCAVIEVTLVPLRLGTTVVPLSVLLAIVSNVAVPTLSRRAVPVTAAALLPALAWAATVIVLSSARPEGDVLLVGTAPLVYVTYALLGAGIVSAMATVVRGQARAGAVRSGSANQSSASSARSTRR